MRIADISPFKYKAYTRGEINETFDAETLKKMCINQYDIISRFEAKIKMLDILGLFAGSYQLPSTPSLGFSDELLQKARKENARLTKDNCEYLIELGHKIQETFDLFRERDEILAELKKVKASNEEFEKQLKKKPKVRFAESRIVKQDQLIKDILEGSREKQYLSDDGPVLEKIIEIPNLQMIESCPLELDPWQSYKDIIDLDKINRRCDFEMQFMKTLINITTIDISSEIKPDILVAAMKDHMRTGLSLKQRIQRLLTRCLKIAINMRTEFIRGISLNPKVLEEMDSNTADVEDFFTEAVRRSSGRVS